MNPLSIFPRPSNSFRKKTSVKLTQFSVAGLIFVGQFFILSICIAAQEVSSRHPFSPAANTSGNGPVAEDYTWWYAALAVISLGLAAALAWWFKEKAKMSRAIKLSKQETGKTNTKGKRNKTRKPVNYTKDDEVDDWIQASYTENKKQNSAKNKAANGNGNINKVNGSSPASLKKGTPDSYGFETFKGDQAILDTNFDRQTPANSNGNSWQLNPPRAFEELPFCEDESVIDAIEQIREDDGDEMMRSLALRVLSASKSRESVEGLQQIAIYDQSAQLRVDAIGALGGFDHETVFEPILLACVDPAREVRAAAAKALSRLSFDRADSFVRVIDSRDSERLRLASLACIETGFAERAFERVSATDAKHSYEAFTILTLLVKAEEFEPILNTIKEHPNMQIRLTTLKVLRNLNPIKMLPSLYELSLNDELPAEVKTGIEELIFQMSHAV